MEKIGKKLPFRVVSREFCNARPPGFNSSVEVRVVGLGFQLRHGIHLWVCVFVVLMI